MNFPLITPAVLVMDISDPIHSRKSCHFAVSILRRVVFEKKLFRNNRSRDFLRDYFLSRPSRVSVIRKKRCVNHTRLFTPKYLFSEASTCLQYQLVTEDVEWGVDDSSKTRDDRGSSCTYLPSWLDNRNVNEVIFNKNSATLQVKDYFCTICWLSFWYYRLL